MTGISYVFCPNYPSINGLDQKFSGEIKIYIYNKKHTMLKKNIMTDYPFEQV